MFKEEKKEIDVIIQKLLDKRFGKDDKFMKYMIDAQIDIRTDQRFGKNNSLIEKTIDDKAGHLVALALEHIDDKFKIVAEGFQTTNNRLDRLINLLIDREVIEEGMF
ncbi:MAG: hypothetical protein WC629_01990 [Candidatus Paceibacterota bacterium]|jgi:hypothetical protein